VHDQPKFIVRPLYITLHWFPAELNLYQGISCWIQLLRTSYTSRSHALQYFELFERIFFPPLFPIQQNELTTRPAVHAWDTIWTLSLHSALCCELHHFLLRYSILSLVVLHSQLESVLRTSCCRSSLVWSHPGWVWPCETISADSLDTRFLHMQQSVTKTILLSDEKPQGLDVVCLELWPWSSIQNLPVTRVTTNVKSAWWLSLFCRIHNKYGKPHPHPPYAGSQFWSQL